MEIGSKSSNSSTIKLTRAAFQTLFRAKYLEYVADKNNPVNSLMTEIEETKQNIEEAGKERLRLDKALEEIVERQETFLRRRNPKTNCRSVGVNTDESIDDWEVICVDYVEPDILNLDSPGSSISTPVQSNSVQTEVAVPSPASNNQPVSKRRSGKTCKIRPKQFVTSSASCKEHDTTF